jgi:tRNA nucleotidyltransferase (CCA-adding enzyme)
MKTWLVGGAVRDTLMGLPVKDRDWVVVGAAVQDMLDAGYTPVGRDFPVFLHPKTREEYALARTERKSAPGYRGFVVHASPDVTLEEDLARRDLTINSIAVHADSTGAIGQIIDPFGGQSDIGARILRHVTLAFREDPVRILRVARFAARFGDFQVAPETQTLMREMVASGEADHLVAERVWQELSRGLMEARPSRMFEVLRDCGALPVLLPELQLDAARMQVIDRAAAQNANLPVRFALIDPDGNAALHQRLRIPQECAELSAALARNRAAIRNSLGQDASGLVQLLEQCDAIRKPERFADMLLACRCEANDAQWPPANRLTLALTLAQGIATNSIAALAKDMGAIGPQIGEKIREARVMAVANGMATA